MFQSGYSGKSLIVKLGYTPDENIGLYNELPEFKDYLQTEGIATSDDLTADWVHGFFMSRAELMIFLDTVKFSQIKKSLWVSWPKKSSGLQTDLNEQTFRDTILPLGWVDTKVCAINDTWSGLKFLRRKA